MANEHGKLIIDLLKGGKMWVNDTYTSTTTDNIKRWWRPPPKTFWRINNIRVNHNCAVNKIVSVYCGRLKPGVPIDPAALNDDDYDGGHEIDLGTDQDVVSGTYTYLTLGDNERSFVFDHYWIPSIFFVNGVALGKNFIVQMNMYQVDPKEVGIKQMIEIRGR